MRIIFYKIQHLKLDDPKSVQRFTALNKGTIESFDQLNLFWGDNPRVIVTIIQYIQFWYAIGLAGVFVYFPKWGESADWTFFLYGSSFKPIEIAHVFVVVCILSFFFLF
jgi:hypothetical protein